MARLGREVGQQELPRDSLEAENERLKALVEQYETVLTWNQSCVRCGVLLDHSYTKIQHIRSLEDLAMAMYDADKTVAELVPLHMMAQLENMLLNRRGERLPRGVYAGRMSENEQIMKRPRSALGSVE